MGRHPSNDQPGMATELGADYALLCVPCRDSQGDLHNQRGRVAEHESAQNHQDALFVPERGSGSAATLAGASKSLEEMELCAGLAPGAEPVSDSMAGADADVEKELNRQSNRKPKTAQSSPAGARVLVPTGTARAPGGSQNGARRQGFAGAAPR